MFALKKISGVLLAAVLIFTICYQDGFNGVTVSRDIICSAENEPSMDFYIEENQEISFGKKFVLDGNDVLLTDSGYAEWSFDIPEKSAYIIRIKYAADDNAMGDINFTLKIDGNYPIEGTELVVLKRLYLQDEGKFETDASGNDIKPEVTQSKDYQWAEITDSKAYTGEAVVFVLEKGSHTLRLEGRRGNFKISEIEFGKSNDILSYKEYKELYSKFEHSVSEIKPIVIEGEKFFAKNSVTLMPSTDRTSAATNPQSAYNLKLNTVGGNSWKTVGDSVIYKVQIENAGLYNIALRFRQNLKDGIFVCRKLLIDGKAPFLEAESLRFYYNDSWQTEFLGEQEAFAIYLDKGEHELRFEAVHGDTAEIIGKVSDSLKKLNDICRKITLITGNTLDVNRDYNFNEAIPEQLENMRNVCEQLRETVNFINSQAGTSGSYVSILEKIIFQLEAMTENQRTIAKYFARLKSNLGALSEWLLTASEQPLEIDNIHILPNGSKKPENSEGFLKNLSFWIKCFIASYINEYNSIGSSGSTDTLKVWIQTGRDQGEIIRELINSDFSLNYNTSVQLEIVTGTLLESVLSGISPDIVFDNAETIPMDYALRNAVVDFTEFDDFEKFSQIFPKASLLPATFKEKVYGIPQTMSFYMFFYRTDIFEEYGYEVPKTWTELCDMIPTLQRNAHEIGIPHDLQFYATLLYQSGGKLYSDSLRSTNIDSNTAIEKFVDFTEFFTLYDCPVSYNFANRFRSGEMPCAIAPYTEYNQLIAFAPEINGDWKMLPIPGCPDNKGNINNISVASMTYIMMMKSSKNKDKAWEYIKWFMSESVQMRFATQMESLLGNCAKVNTANYNALASMSWINDERDALLSQMNSTEAIPQMPGGYYLSRVISFAFNRVYNNAEDAAETLTDYCAELNSELSRKHKEFGLD